MAERTTLSIFDEGTTKGNALLSDNVFNAVNKAANVTTDGLGNIISTINSSFNNFFQQQRDLSSTNSTDSSSEVSTETYAETIVKEATEKIAEAKTETESELASVITDKIDSTALSNKEIVDSIGITASDNFTKMINDQNKKSVEVAKASTIDNKLDTDTIARLEQLSRQIDKVDSNIAKKEIQTKIAEDSTANAIMSKTELLAEASRVAKLKDELNSKYREEYLDAKFSLKKSQKAHDELQAKIVKGEFSSEKELNAAYESLESLSSNIEKQKNIMALNRQRKQEENKKLNQQMNEVVEKMGADSEVNFELKSAFGSAYSDARSNVKKNVEKTEIAKQESPKVEVEKTDGGFLSSMSSMIGEAVDAVAKPFVEKETSNQDNSNAEVESESEGLISSVTSFFGDLIGGSSTPIVEKEANQPNIENTSPIEVPKDEGTVFQEAKVEDSQSTANDATTASSIAELKTSMDDLVSSMHNMSENQSKMTDILINIMNKSSEQASNDVQPIIINKTVPVYSGEQHRIGV